MSRRLQGKWSKMRLGQRQAKALPPLAAALLLAMAACSAPEAANRQAAQDEPPVQAAADDAPYYTELPLNELMVHVLQYSADGIWERQGFVVDAAGEHSLFPKNDEEWEKAESAALTLAEVTNTLLVPRRRVREAEWDRAVEAVRKVAIEAAKAAEKQDKQAFSSAGEKLDAACDACHVRYDPRFKPVGG